ncbi:MAG: DegT/DnrJ/EryC1/StrS family aminotransferase [Actinobacteria bacterium]|nr:DegT/DnrJ/EryC1/StrS family aminotransferase [Actinomycetota bacterium]
MSRAFRRRSDFLPFARPDLDGRELDMVKEVLDSGWITTGAVTKRLERDFADRIGAGYAVAVNSATAALHLALEAVGLKAGDEVITTPYTFASTAEVVRYFDAKPRFVDIDQDTLNIDPEKIEAAITPRTRAIIPVHIGGHPADLDPIDELARSSGLAVIEDAAHALPAVYRGTIIGQRRPALGSNPHLVCFSFYATKTMTTGEGGMICTDDKSLAERCRLMSLHGISANAWNRYAAEGSWYYEIVAPGFKYNLTDIAAAIGLAQLQRLDEMSTRRAQIACRYTDAFHGVGALKLPADHAWVEHAWHLYPLRLELGALTIDRADFVRELKSRNIGTSVHFIPLHLHPYYRQKYGFSPDDFPVANREFEREVSLPIYSRMSDDDVSDVIEAVLHVVRTFES